MSSLVQPADTAARTKRHETAPSTGMSTATVGPLAAILLWAISCDCLALTTQQPTATSPTAIEPAGTFRSVEALLNDSGNKFDGYVQGGFVRNNTSTVSERHGGLSNYPIPQVSDENFSFNTIQTFLHKDIEGNIQPRGRTQAWGGSHRLQLGLHDRVNVRS